MGPFPLASGRSQRLLGIFAHPDDEVFCAGGVLARWTAGGNEAMIVSATRGEAGQIQDAAAATRHTLGAVRERELRVACERLGVYEVECLDHPDGRLREVDEAILTHEVAARIRAFDPAVVITFGPDGGYGHPDHIAISAATARAFQEIARAGGHVPRSYYSVFPRRHRLLCLEAAHWLARRDSHFRGSEAFVRALTLLVNEASLLGYADDTVEVRWFPVGFSILEQGEAGNSLYLIVSGHADVIHEPGDGAGRVSRRVGPGEFFGQEALAQHRSQPASVVAADVVTCLVLSTRAQTAFDGRGEDAHLGKATAGSHGHDEDEPRGLLATDVSPWLDRKLAALSAHRTQFPLEPAFPAALLEQWLGREYFARVTLATIGDHASAPSTRTSTEPLRQWALAIPS